MKFVVALLLFLAVPAALALFDASIEDDLCKLEEECSKVSGFDAESVEKVRTNRDVPDEEAANKWAKCMLQKHNVITSDGKVNLNVNTIGIPADTDTVIRAFPKCSKLEGRDIDDTARLMFNCYRKNSEGLLMGFRRRRTQK